MKQIKAKTKNRNYRIFLGPDITSSCSKWINQIKEAEKILLVSNDKISSIYQSLIIQMLKDTDLQYHILLVGDGEEYKSMDSCQQIYAKLLEENFHRNDILVAFGGGVIGDLAGFAAATYHRGLKLLQYPTTIISQVDSSIGGKVAVNFKKIKNIVGTFYQPHMVIADTRLLYTLDHNEILNGLGEVIKYGIVFDSNILRQLEAMAEEAKDIEKAIKSESFGEVIYRCAKIKAKVVAADEYDLGYRNLLNFGHTVGHALEKAANLTSINHGQAVALGMLVAIDISIGLGFLGKEFKKMMVALYQKLNMPTKIMDMDVDSVIAAMGYDKKFTDKKNKFVLLKGLNKPFFYYGLKQDIIINSIKKNMGKK